MKSSLGTKGFYLDAQVVESKVAAFLKVEEPKGFLLLSSVQISGSCKSIEILAVGTPRWVVVFKV